MLIGRLTKDPELKFTPGTGTAIANATIAIDRKMPGKDGKKEADFINIIAWGKTGENLANYMTKGKMIAVAGRIQVRNYDNKEGKKVYITEVVAEEIQFLEKATRAGQNNSNTGNNLDEYGI